MFLRFLLILLWDWSRKALGRKFQILTPWYLIHFWQRVVENLGKYKLFLILDLVWRAWTAVRVWKNEEKEKGMLFKKKKEGRLWRSSIKTVHRIHHITFHCFKIKKAFLFLNYSTISMLKKLLYFTEISMQL